MVRRSPCRRVPPAPGARWLRAAGLLGAALLAACALGMPRADATPAGEHLAAPANLMSRAARRLGVRRCLPALRRLSSLALLGAAADDVVLDWDRRTPDTSPFFGLMGVVSPDTGTHAATFTMIPARGGSCTLLAERIAWAPQACREVARDELSGYRRSGLLPGMNVFQRADDDGGTVTLIRAGPGCLVLRRFVRYRWREAAPRAPRR